MVIALHDMKVGINPFGLGVHVGEKRRAALAEVERNSPLG
jgi:hypothetical protein